MNATVETVAPLPSIAPDTPTLLEPARFDPLIPARRRTILLVEDDEDARESVRILLVGNGFDVIEAASAEEALVALTAYPLDAVLLDVVLPDGSGLDISQAMRVVPRLAQIPVVMLSGLGSLGDEVDGVLAGADAYLVKPATGRQILERLEDVL